MLAKIKYHLLYIVFLWTILTFFNLNKAFHIDDTFHIEVAQWIEKNPTSPMSGKANWGNNPNYIHSFNQPPLFFYAIAIWGYFLGYSEVSLHLLMSVFSLICLLFFYKIIGFFSQKNQIMYLSLFAFSPIFIINQNIMTDVPLLSVMLVFVYYVLKEPQRLSNLILASVFLGVSLLIKYTTLPLFLILIFVIIKKHTLSKLWILLIPIGFLVLWSIFNWYEYQSIHFFDRPKNEFSFIRIFGLAFIFVVCIGSLFPFLLIFFDKFKNNKKYLWSYILIFVLLALATYSQLISAKISDQLIYFFFIIIGFTFVIFSFLVLKSLIHDFKFQTLVVGIIGLSAFMILFAPFMASRHFLLLLPFFILMCIPLFEKASNYFKVFILCVCIVFGVLTSLSDWHYADYYRDKAALFANKYPNSYSIGHWGWHYYSKKNNMKIYGRDSSKLIVGDYLIGPIDVAKQSIHPSLELVTIEKYVEPAHILTFISGKKYASMYNASSKKTSWNFSNQPIDTIIVYQVKTIDSTLVE